MVTLSDTRDIVRVLADTSSSPDYFFEALTEYAGLDDASDPISEMNFVARLGRAVHRYALGFFLDNNDVDGMNEHAHRIVESTIGFPDPSETQTYVPFTYKGGRLGEGLVAFDDWLEHDYHWNVARRIYLYGQKPQTVFETATQRRLVELDSMTDASISLIHPNSQIDELIDRFEALGIRARRQSLGRWHTL